MLSIRQGQGPIMGQPIWFTLAVLVLVVTIPISATATAADNSTQPTQPSDLCYSNHFDDYPADLPLPIALSNTTHGICWLSLNSSLSSSQLISNGVSKITQYNGIAIAIQTGIAGNSAYYTTSMIIGENTQGAISTGIQKDLKPDHHIPLGMAISCAHHSQSGRDRESVDIATSTIDLSGTDFVINPFAAKWSTIHADAPSASGLLAHGDVKPSVVWPYWHHVTITSQVKHTAGTDTGASGGCSFQAPVPGQASEAADGHGISGSDMTLPADAINSLWNGRTVDGEVSLIPIVRLLRLGVSNTLSTAISSNGTVIHNDTINDQSHGHANDNGNNGTSLLKQETSYQGVVIGVSTKRSIDTFEYIRMIIPSLSSSWSTTKGSQDQWSLSKGVPFGSAYDCTYGVSTAMSIIDLTNASTPTQAQGRWHVDTRYTSWSMNGDNSSSIPITDPSYVYITANGTCSSTRPRTQTSNINGHNGNGNGNGDYVFGEHVNEVMDGYVAITFVTQQDLTVCELAGLANYPTTVPSCVHLPGPTTSVCWLPLGPTTAQQTRSQGADNPSTVTSYYDGIGVMVIPTRYPGDYEYYTINCDYNGVTTTVRRGLTPYYSAHALPFGASFACGVAVSYIDLRLTKFIVDPTQTWKVCDSGAGTGEGFARPSNGWPSWDFITISTTGACSWITPMTECGAGGESGAAGLGSNNIRLNRVSKPADTLCRTLGLEEYPFWKRSPSEYVPAGAKLCWLNLGESWTMSEAVQVQPRMIRTSFTGIGAFASPDSNGTYNIDIITHDWNAATTTTPAAPVYQWPDHPVPFGSVYTCDEQPQAEYTTYIDLRKTPFIVDPDTTWRKCGPWGSIMTYSPNSVFPFWDLVTITAQRPTNGTGCAYVVPSTISGARCDDEDYSGAWNNPSTIRIIRVLKLGSDTSISRTFDQYGPREYTSKYNGVAISTVHANARYLTYINPSKSFGLAVNSGDNQSPIWTPKHAVPFGSSFQCVTSYSYASSSTMDLRNTPWYIDTAAAIWTRQGVGNTGIVDVSNPRFIVLQVTGCGFTSNGGTVLQAWSGQTYIPIINNATISCVQECKNGGVCNGINTCACSYGFTGDDCSTVTLPCGDCFNGFCSTPVTCSCYAQWTGRACNITTCQPSCSSHGICQADHTCKCQPGYNGTLCDTPTCDNPNLCGDHGRCKGANSCACDQYWSGPTCAIHQCNSVTCVKGTCASSTSCSCPSTQWTGVNCSQPICSAGCSNTTGSCTVPGTCVCNPGYTGTNCDIPVCINRGNCGGPSHGTCIGPDTCACATGWSGSNCTLIQCDVSCVHGKCLSVNQCTCDNGWTSSATGCNTPVCSPSCVSGHGNCTAPNICTCINDGWSDATCATPVCPAGCNTQHGSCTAPFTCTCQTGWTGSDCTTRACPNGCGHGGCASDGVTCTCEPNWRGITCNEAICNPPCGINGTCSSPNTCTCKTGYTGARCDVYSCPGCDLAHGQCIAPGVCQCDNDWGPDNTCSQPQCNGGCLHGGICSTTFNNCTCATGWGGQYCEVALCLPSTLCGGHGTCNSTALEPNQCICDEHWSGARCSQSDADVQSLVVITAANGIKVIDPFENYAQQVPLKDATLVQAISSTSMHPVPLQLLHSFDGGLLTIADNSLYHINPWTGTSTIFPVGHGVASGAVALALTSDDATMYMVRNESLYWLNQDSLYSPVLFGNASQWKGVTAMTAVSDYEVFIANDQGLWSVYTWSDREGETVLLPNTEWAINARYITAVGQMIYGFGPLGRLWSYDSVLHVSRNHQRFFHDITGITSDGKRIIFVSEGAIWATASDLASLDEMIFESYTYDVTFNRTTAITWLHGLAHVISHGSLWMVSVEPQQVLEQSFILNPLSGSTPGARASCATSNGYICITVDLGVNAGEILCTHIVTGVSFPLSFPDGYRFDWSRDLVYWNESLYVLNGGGTVFEIPLAPALSGAVVTPKSISGGWSTASTATMTAAHDGIYTVDGGGRLCRIKIPAIGDKCELVITTGFSNVKAITAVLDAIFVAADNTIWRIPKGASWPERLEAPGNWQSVTDMTNINGMLYVMLSDGTLYEISRTSYASSRVVGFKGQWLNAGVKSIAAFYDRSLWYDIGVTLDYQFRSLTITNGSSNSGTVDTSNQHISRSTGYDINADVSFTCFASTPTESYLNLTIKSLNVTVSGDDDDMPANVTAELFAIENSMVVVQSRNGTVLHVYAHVNESTEAINFKRQLASLLNTYSGVQVQQTNGTIKSTAPIHELLLSGVSRSVPAALEADVAGTYHAHYSLQPLIHESVNINHTAVHGYRIVRSKSSFNHYHPAAQSRARINAISQRRDAVTGQSVGDVNDYGTDQEVTIDRVDNCVTDIYDGFIQTRSCSIASSIMGDSNPLANSTGGGYNTTSNRVGGNSQVSFRLVQVSSLGCNSQGLTGNACFHSLNGYRQHRVEFEPVVTSDIDRDDVDSTIRSRSTRGQGYSVLIRRIISHRSGCYDRISCVRMMSDVMPLLHNGMRFGYDSSLLITDLSFIANNGLRTGYGTAGTGGKGMCRLDTVSVYHMMISSLASHGSESSQRVLIHEFENRHHSKGSLKDAFNSRDYILLQFAHIAKPSIAWSQPLQAAYTNGYHTAALSLSLLVDRTGHHESYQFLVDLHQRAMNRLHPFGIHSAATLDSDLDKRKETHDQDAVTHVRLLSNAMGNIRNHASWDWLHDISGSSSSSVRETATQIINHMRFHGSPLVNKMISSFQYSYPTIISNVSNTMVTANNPSLGIGYSKGATFTRSVGNDKAGIVLDAQYGINAGIDKYLTIEASTNNFVHFNAHLFDYYLNIIDAAGTFDIRSYRNDIHLILGEGTSYRKVVFQQLLPCIACILKCRGPAGSFGSGAREVFSFSSTVMVGPLPIELSVGLWAGYNFNYQFQFCILNRPPSFLNGFGATASVYASASASVSLLVVRGGLSVDLAIFDGRLEPRLTLNLNEVCAKADFEVSALSGHIDAWWERRGCGGWRHLWRSWCGQNRYTLLSWKGPSLSYSYPPTPCYPILGTTASSAWSEYANVNYNPSFYSSPQIEHNSTFATPNGIERLSVWVTCKDAKEHVAAKHDEYDFGVYGVVFDTELKSALRTAYIIYPRAAAGSGNDGRDYIVDTALLPAQQMTSYSSPWTKGHLVRRIDFVHNSNALDVTNSYINLVPQLKAFNMAWNTLEIMVEGMVLIGDKWDNTYRGPNPPPTRPVYSPYVGTGADTIPVYVVTGTCGSLDTMDGGRVPHKIWKAICTKTRTWTAAGAPGQGVVKTIGFFGKNQLEPVPLDPKESPYAHPYREMLTPRRPSELCDEKGNDNPFVWEPPTTGHPKRDEKVKVGEGEGVGPFKWPWAGAGDFMAECAAAAHAAPDQAFWWKYFSLTDKGYDKYLQNEWPEADYRV